MKKKSLFIGNIQTKETHKESCYYVTLMKKENMIKFSSLKEAINYKFDTCGHCLKRTERLDTVKAPDEYKYTGYFCTNLNGSEYCNYGSTNVIGEAPKGIIKLYVKLYSNNDETPIENAKIRFTYFPNDINEEEISIEHTNEYGIAKIEFNAEDIVSGITRFRAYFPESTDFNNSLISNNYMDMLIDVLQSIGNLRATPKKFHRSTTITFDLLKDTEIDISIYANTYFLRPFSHRKTIRSFKDGVLKKGHNKVVWDGTNDRNKLTFRGKYVVLLRTPDDKDVVFQTGLHKDKGKWYKGK